MNIVSTMQSMSQIRRQKPIFFVFFEKVENEKTQWKFL